MHTLTGYACMHAPGTHTHTRPTHEPGPCLLAGSPHPLARRAHLARLHQVLMPAHSWGPSCTLALGHACTLASGHACTLAPGPHACSVSMYARTGPMCACSLQVPTPTRTWGPYARSLAGSPCMCAGSLHLCMLHPMLYVVVVICSSTVCILV